MEEDNKQEKISSDNAHEQDNFVTDGQVEDKSENTVSVTTGADA